MNINTYKKEDQQFFGNSIYLFGIRDLEEKMSLFLFLYLLNKKSPNIFEKFDFQECYNVKGKIFYDSLDKKQKVNYFFNFS